MKISALGDSALCLDFADEFSNPEACLQRTLSAAEALKRAKIPGILEIASAYESLALFLNLGTAIDPSMRERISSAIADTNTAHRFHQRDIQIPVCYDEDFALDIARVASETSFPIRRIIELHSRADFTVACIGFMPGFPYLAGLPSELQVPRRATPRTKIPAGSVAIADAQAGIYPFESPGGWNIIGRTPLRLFDPNSTPPTLLAAGDRVRFFRINRDEFEATIPNEK